MDPNSKTAPELEIWLATATERLVPEAKTMIRAEIEAHCLDALDEAVAAGASETEAADEALRRLGDPRRAHRAYRRQFPTVKEARHVQRLMEAKQKPVPIGLVVFRCLILWVVLDSIFGSRALLFPSTYLAITGFAVAAFTWTRMRNRRAASSERDAMRFHLLEGLFSLFLLTMWFAMLCTAPIVSEAELQQHFYTRMIGAFLPFVLAFWIYDIGQFWLPWKKMQRCKEPRDPRAGA